MVVELKTGARLPDGSTVTILGRYVQRTLGAGVTEIIPLFSGFVLPPGFPTGAYTIEAALLEPDLGVPFEPAQRDPDAAAVKGKDDQQ